MGKLNLLQGIQVGAALAKIGGVAVSIGTKLFAALPGGITADEAEAIAVAELAGEDIKIKINGIDVIDEGAEKHFEAALARVARNITHALTHKG
jgi:hypothetical protein